MLVLNVDVHKRDKHEKNKPNKKRHKPVINNYVPNEHKKEEAGN